MPGHWLNWHCSNLMNPHNYPMRQALSFPHFTDEETEAHSKYGKSIQTQSLRLLSGHSLWVLL